MRVSMTVRLVAALAVASTLAACSGGQASPEEYLARGDGYAEKGQYPEAIVEYRSALNVDNRNWQAHDKLAELYVKTGDGQRALRSAVLAADLQPDNADLQLRAGRYLLIAGQHQDARTRAESVLERDRRNVAATLLKASATIGLRDLSSALETLEEATALDPENIQSYMIMGQLRAGTGALAEAEGIFKQAVAQQPKSLDAQLGLANFYWSTGRRAEAETSLRAAVALAPQNSIAQRALGIYLLSTGRGAEAESAFKAIATADPTVRSRLALADYYLGQNRPQDALEVLNRLLQDPDGFVDAKIRLATLDYARNQKPAALKHIDEALARDPKNVDAMVSKAQMLLADNKRDEAVALARSATGADPSSSRAQYFLGAVLAARGELDAAIAAFNETARLSPRVAAPQVQLAAMHLQQGNVKAAEQAANAAMLLTPDSVPARLMMARVAMVNGDLRRASDETEKLVAERPNSAPVQALVGDLRMLQKNFGAARQAFARTLELDPANLSALRGMVTVNIGDRNPRAAQAVVEERLKATPDDPAILLLAADTFETTGDTRRREQMLRHLIDVDPSNIRAYAALARLYVELDQLDKAKAQFDQILAKSPNAIGASTMVALILESQGKTAEAVKAYERVLAIEPGAILAANNLAWLYAEGAGNLDVALDLAQGAKQRAPKTPQLDDTIGWIYLKKNLPQLAIQAFRTSAETEPANPVYRYHLGLAYIKNGDRIRAREALDEALRLRPGYPEAVEARKTLS
jgi:putative PEP-CTERM system TPR-repeat lipoprotein